MKIEVPLGDVVDKITILELKVARLEGEARFNAQLELTALAEAWEALHTPLVDVPEYAALRGVNLQLWDVEDALREHERRQDFGDAFVASARRVYQLNDHRAELKRALNLRLGSRFVEEKSYPDYRK